MTFDELLDQACKSAHLPEMARIQLPSSLSEKTKRNVMRLSPEELGQILANAIDTVNHGSIESIDALMNRALKR